MKHTIYILLAILILGACKEDKPKTDKRIHEINSVPNAADIIRNPVTANGLEDTTNLAKIQFDQLDFDFGTVNEGEKVKHTFSFTNTGELPLIISDARSTCGCTVPKYPREPIAPGKTGKINVVFDTAGKKEKQHKPVTITANTFPSKTVLNLNGFVTPK